MDERGMQTQVDRNQWSLVKKEIVGIHLLWEMLNKLYFDKKSQEWAGLNNDAPVFFHLTLSTYIESLVGRIARLMDRPQTTGRDNLSLNRLAELDPALQASVAALCHQWDEAGLQQLRNQYLTHNDLDRMLTEPHTVSIPVSDDGMTALAELVKTLVALAVSVNNRLGLGVLIAETTTKRAEFERDVLNRNLKGARLFFSELDSNDALQRAWHAGDAHG